MSKNKRFLLVIGIAAILWPFIFDEVELGCYLSPHACTEAEPLAFFIILSSILLGSFLLSFSWIKKDAGWKKYLSTLEFGALISIACSFAYYVITFIREFRF